MCIVTSFTFILNVSYSDGNSLSFVANCTTFCNLRVIFGFSQTLSSLNCKNRTSGGCLTMVNVADRTHVDVGFCTFESLLGHFLYLSSENDIVSFPTGLNILLSPHFNSFTRRT